MPARGPEVPLPEWARAWLADVVASDPVEMVVWRSDDFLRFAAALFRNPQALEPYGPEQAERMLTNLHIKLALTLRDENAPLDLCLDAVVATDSLYRHWYNRIPEYTHSGEYFWDSVCYMYTYGEELSEREQAIEDAIFRTLTTILALVNPRCQAGALHGFNHLKDDRCHLVIDNYIARCNDPELVAYARLFDSTRGYGSSRNRWKP